MTRALLMCMPDIYQSWHETHIKGPWLGGASIAGNCPEHDVYVADLVLKRKDVRGGVKEAIARIDPQVIGLSAMTFQYPTAVRVANYIRENYPKIPIALGGYHATALREEIASSEEGQGFDYLFAGEAEHTFRQFLDNEAKTNISGLSYKQDGTWIHNPRHKAILKSQGLDAISPPKRDSRIWKGYRFHSRDFDTAESSRGCDYACKFCSMRSMMPNARFSPYSLDRVITDLKSAKQRGTNSIFFTDDNPAMDAEKFKLFLERILAEGLEDVFYSGMVSTERMADKGLTRLMKKAGWDFVFLGVENVYDANLKGMRKKSNEDLAKRAIDSLYKAGITILAGIISGNPEDTEETIRGNFKWFQNCLVDAVMPQFITPYPGTESRKNLLERGLVVNEGGMNNQYGGWTTYNGEFAHCRTKSGLMPEDIERIVYEETIIFNRIRNKNLFAGRLSFAKNNPWHLFNWVLHRSVPTALIAIKERGLSIAERAKRERQRKVAMNQFNI